MTEIIQQHVWDFLVLAFFLGVFCGILLILFLPPLLMPIARDFDGKLPGRDL